MNPSKRRMSPGWIFAAGSLFGALAVLAPIASSGTSSARGDAFRHRRPPAEPVVETDGARAWPTSLEDIPPAPPRLTSVDSKKTRSGPPPRTTARHSELDLQLD